MTAVPVQPVVLADGLWSCAWCAATLEDRGITHRDDCRWIAEIRAADPATETEGFRAYKAGAAAERERIVEFLRLAGYDIAADDIENPEDAE